MIQIRIHGRGGQGVVTAAEILSIAAFVDGKHAQAFPNFGSGDVSLAARASNVTTVRNLPRQCYYQEWSMQAI